MVNGYDILPQVSWGDVYCFEASGVLVRVAKGKLRAFCKLGWSIEHCNTAATF